MIRYRLYTENKNLSRIRELTAHAFKGFTTYYANGFWEGKREESFVIEIITDWIGVHDAIRNLAKNIKDENKQEAVMITAETVEMELI